MRSSENLWNQFKRQDVMTKIMVINGAVFLVFSISSALMAWSRSNVYSWFALPDDPIRFLGQPWSLLTYSFLHSGFFHLLFNMIWLSFFGRFVLNLFPARRFLTLYLLGGIVAGLVYLISYNVFPAFLGGPNGQLVGASGAVMAIMAFAALYSPYATVRVFFFSLKLWQLAAIMVLWDLIRLPEMNNAGGLLAHLGGAAFGYYYGRNLQSGRDVGMWFDRLIDRLTLLWPRFSGGGNPTFKNRSSSAKKSRSKSTSPNAEQEKIDAILDKIGQSGYESLTKEEKDFLFRSGRN
jgi:membrane associated rhomboid family serine protease